MLYTIPMFFYNGLFHARRPDPIDDDDDDEHENLPLHHQGSSHNESQEQQQHEEPESAQQVVAQQEQNESSRVAAGDSHYSQPTMDSPLMDQKQDVTQEWTTGPVTADADEDAPSVLSTGSNRIRSLQSQIQQWMIQEQDEDDDDYFLNQSMEEGVPPMPKIPFVSIDVRGFLEETEHSEEEEDDDEDEEQPMLSWKKKQLSVESNTRDVTSQRQEQSRVALEDDTLVNESNPPNSSSSSSPSLEHQEDAEEEESCCDSKSSYSGWIKKPQSFLLDFLTASKHYNKPTSTTQSSSSSSSSSNSSSKSSSSNSPSCSDDSAIKSSCSALNPSLKELLRAHAHFQEQHKQQQQQQSSRLSVTSSYWTDTDHPESHPVTGTASTPYHHPAVVAKRQHTGSSARRRTVFYQNNNNNRCLVPSHISFSEPMEQEAEGSVVDFCPPGTSMEGTCGGCEPLEYPEILDPADPLECGRIDDIHFPYLRSVSDQMNVLLGQIEQEENDHCGDGLLSWMAHHPMVCQVKYPPPSQGGNVCHTAEHAVCLPLHYFCAIGWLQGCQAAYDAYPEAIGVESSSSIGLPLHYACLHQHDNYKVISFLLDKFPDAARFTNTEFHQTPLHLACQSYHCRLDTVQLLLEQYPTAAQLADAQGFTPLHYACQHRLGLDILQALQASGPAVIGAATKTWHKPLHLAALYGCNVHVLQWLVQSDRRAAACTLDDFSTPLHCAVMGLFQEHGPHDQNKSLDTIVAKLECLRQAHPEAVHWTNANDQTPYDLAVELHVNWKPRNGLSNKEDDSSDFFKPILQVLMPPSPTC